MALCIHRSLVLLVAASLAVSLVEFTIWDLTVVVNKEIIPPTILRSYEELPGHKIVIIGSGPTALGAAQRLYDLGQEKNNTVITVLEEQGRPGGLASSGRDDRGFLWDIGAHGVRSHYSYFDSVLDRVVPEWNYRHMSAFAFMKGSDGIRRFIPYPVQNNIHTMAKEDQQKILAGLKQISNSDMTQQPENFDQWLLQKFGAGLADVFLRKYYEKMWAVDTTEMNSAWVGELAAVPDVGEIETKIEETDNGTVVKDSKRGLDSLIRFPRHNGTGGIWEAVARLLPRHWFKFHEKVTRVNVDKKVVTVEVMGQGVQSHYTLKYDTLLSTVPLDVFTGLLESDGSSLVQIQELASKLVYTHTHIVGVGLAGQPPKTLADKSWVYFPDSDSPFYLLTVHSNCSDDVVPKAGAYWSLVCEIAQPKGSWSPMDWTGTKLVSTTIQALVSYGLITADMVVSKHYRRLDHGYPVPSLKRDMILDTIQPWLQSKDIYSRGRFGGWRYEVGNQDHSFMQGVEVVDKIVRGVPEETYPNLVFSKVNTGRILPVPLDYEFVISHYNENLDWLKPYADHTHVYHKGSDPGPPFKLYAWERSRNVGRESHTYLHHIIQNYDRLSNSTIFLQGNIKNHGACLPRNPLKFLSLADRGIPCQNAGYKYKYMKRIPFPKNFRSDPKYRDLVRANVTYAYFYRDLMGASPPRGGVPFCHCGCFAATKAMVLRHPLEFYKKAISYVSSHSNPEEGHYFERTWYAIFKS